MDHNTIIYDPTAKLEARAGHLSRRCRKTAKSRTRNSGDRTRSNGSQPNPHRHSRKDVMA